MIPLYTKIRSSLYLEKGMLNFKDLATPSKLNRIDKALALHTFYNSDLYAIYDGFPIKKLVENLRKYFTKSQYLRYDENSFNEFAYISTLCVLYAMHVCINYALPYGDKTSIPVDDENVPVDLSTVVLTGNFLSFAVALENQDYTLFDKQIYPHIRKALNICNNKFGIPVTCKKLVGSYAFRIPLNIFDEYKEDIENRINYNLEFQKDGDSFDLKDPLKGLF